MPEAFASFASLYAELLLLREMRAAVACYGFPTPTLDATIARKVERLRACVAADLLAGLLAEGQSRDDAVIVSRDAADRVASDEGGE